jgi:hypothetical protein
MILDMSASNSGGDLPALGYPLPVMKRASDGRSIEFEDTHCYGAATDRRKDLDYRFKAIRLVVRKPVANPLYLFDPRVWVKVLQFSRR